MPMHKLSNERAIARNIDSFESIIFELSKSDDIGLLKIFGDLFCLFNDLKHIYIPIDIRRKLPINFVKKLGSMTCINFPKYIDKYVIVIEIINKISLPINDILVFFIPYVIPIPSESILLEIDNKIEFNIITPLYNII